MKKNRGKEKTSFWIAQETMNLLRDLVPIEERDLFVEKAIARLLPERKRKIEKQQHRALWKEVERLRFEQGQPPLP
jgi:hypothetical protein